MGVCIQQWENFTCDCTMTSYTGTQCNDREYRCLLTVHMQTDTQTDAFNFSMACCTEGRCATAVSTSGQRDFCIVLVVTLFLRCIFYFLGDSNSERNGVSVIFKICPEDLQHKSG